LTPANTALLTAVDGENKFAIGAVRECDSREAPGLAEVIRFTDQPDVAEVAIPIVDGLQERGLGRILLERLLHASRQRRIHRVRFEALSSNGRMRNLLHDAAPDAVIHTHGPTFTAEVPLVATAAPRTGG